MTEITDEKVLAFLEEMCQEADKDLAVANRFAGTLRYYYTNVYKTKAISVKEFVASTHMTEARRVYTVEVERELREQKEAARDTEIADLKAQLSEALGLLKGLTENKEQPAKGKSKKQAEAEAEDEE